LSGLAEASAPPPTDLITREINLNLAPVAFASLLRGQAQAIYDPNICAIGQPISYGLGYAANLQLLGAVGQAALATSAGNNNASQTRCTPTSSPTATAPSAWPARCARSPHLSEF